MQSNTTLDLEHLNGKATKMQENITYIKAKRSAFSSSHGGVAIIAMHHLDASE